MPAISGAFDAVIFDMDGVIVDSEPRHQKAFEVVFRELGLEQDHGIEFANYYGHSDRAVWRDFIETHRPNRSLDELASWKERIFLEDIRQHEPIFSPVPGLVSSLSARYRLAVASGSAHVVIQAVLSLKGLDRYFPVTVSAQDVARGKPAPDIFLLTAEKMGVNPHRCWVIEDSAAGVTAAKAAGMAVIAITNTLPAERLSEADVVVSQYCEIEELLLPSIL